MVKKQTEKKGGVGSALAVGAGVAAEEGGASQDSW